MTEQDNDETLGPTTTTIEAEPPVKREKDEILAARQQVTVSRLGTLNPTNLAQQLEVAQAMAKASFAVPTHLRGSPGACLAVLEYASGWGLMAYAVANKSYVVNDRLAFESQLIHSVIEMHAPLHKDSLNFELVGEGDTRRCRVWAQCLIRGTVKLLTWEGTEFGKIKPKNSPLWQTKPDLQLFYNSSRDWARVFFPHILMGAYTKDELQDMNEEQRADLARDVTPAGTGLAARLTGSKGEGFSPENVRVLDGGPTGTADELNNIATDLPDGQAQPEAKPADPPRPAEAPVNPAGGTDPKPTAKPKEKKEPKPKTAAEYIEYFKAWLPKIDNEPEIVKRFGEEKTLRTSCGVMGEDLDTVLVAKNARLTEIRNQ